MKIGNLRVGVPYYIKNCGPKNPDGSYKVNRGVMVVTYQRTNYTPNAPYSYFGYIVSFDNDNLEFLHSEKGDTLEGFCQDLSENYPDCIYSLSKLDENDPDLSLFWEPEILDALKKIHLRLTS